MPPGRVIRAVDHPYRRNMLHILARETMTYSQLFASMEPRGGGRGRFNYHLKVLRESGLIQAQDNHYGLTGSGEAAVAFLEEVNKGSSRQGRLNLPRRNLVPLLVLSVLVVVVALMLPILLSPIAGIPTARPMEAGWSDRMVMDAKGDVVAAGVDPSGNGIVVWEHSEKVYSPGRIDYVGKLHATRFLPGVGWGERASITRPVGDWWSPRVAIDGMGNAFALWSVRLSSGTSSIYVARFAPTEGWNEPILLDQREGQDVSISEVVASASGHAMATWAVEGDMYASFFDSQQGWQTPMVFGPTGEGTGCRRQGCPTVLRMNEDGAAVAVWVQTEGDRQGLWARGFDAQEGWGKPRIYPHGRTAPFDVAIDGNGDALVAWVGGNETQMGMVSSQFLPAYGWTPPTPVGVDNATYDDSLTDGPEVAGFSALLQLILGRNGRAVAAWIHVAFETGHQRAFGSRYAPQAGWEPPSLIDEDMGLGSLRGWNAPCFELVGNPRGSALLLWSEPRVRGGEFVMTSSLRPDTGWSASASIGTVGNIYEAETECPRLAIGPTGDAIAAWNARPGVEASYYVHPQTVEEALADTGHLLDQANARLADLGVWLFLLTALVLLLLATTVAMVLLFWYRGRESRSFENNAAEADETPRTRR